MDSRDRGQENGSVKPQRRPVRGERFVETLSDRERKAYEECVALLQGITESGEVEEACTLLERFVEARANGPAEEEPPTEDEPSPSGT